MSRETVLEEDLLSVAQKLAKVVKSGRPHDHECKYHLDERYPCQHCQALAAFKRLLEKNDV